ncbi:MAG: protein kinase [Bryobacteraceae bacterium]
MPLTPGDKLGPYEILSPLGKGGMGEVYKAHDTRLQRDIAIKISAERFNERFEREGRAVAALNHPNICQIYDVGASPSGLGYLVMELIDGPTLAERIKDGAVPVEETIRYASQIASALTAAHEKAITHRDLKPANIKITPEGVIKVLDFGLAKMGRPASPDSENSPTLTMGGTEVGTLLGTAAYMAPEQARGKDVDKRADIFAFGVVVYEMSTGQRLFHGETISDVLASVLKQEPDWSSVPQRLQRLLKRCLEKDQKKRLQDMGDVDLLLWEAPAVEVGRLSAPSGSRFGALGWMLAGVAVAAAVGVGVVHFRETPAELRAVRTSILPPDDARFDPSSPYPLPALSPDGTRIVFGATQKGGKQQLWVRRLDSTTAQPLPGTENPSTPFWSPDSRWVAFGQGSKLKKIDIQGGPPVVIADLPAVLRGGTWNSEGTILVGANGNAILRVAASGGSVSPLTLQASFQSPHFLPDGRHFIYTATQAGDMPVLVGSLDEPGKPGKEVVKAQSDAQYSQGHLLFLRESTLMAQPFDAVKLETTGDAVAVAEDIPTYTNPSRIAGYFVSPSGLLVYASGAGQSRAVWMDRQGKTLGNLGEALPSFGNISLAPDGKSAVIQYNGDLWIYDTSRGTSTRFTFDPAGDREPVWSPDSSTVYFQSNRTGKYEMYRKPADGSGTEERLALDATFQNALPSSLSPDGKTLLLYGSTSGKSLNDILVLPLASPAGGKPEPKGFLQSLFNESRGTFSPDGNWVAYQSDESGQFQIYVTPYPGPGGKRQISLAGGISPRWRRDGKELFYVTQDGQLMAAPISARNGTLEVGSVQKLFDGVPTSRGILYDVTADGQKFLVADDGVNTQPLTLLQNWTAALRK